MESKNKKKMTLIRKITIIFICIAIGLTFFSKTMYNAGIPEVEIAAVKSGVLTVRYSGEGFVAPAETLPLYASGDLIVEDVLVEKYDEVKAGDVLALLDVSSLEDQLLDMQTSYEKLLYSRKNTSGEARRLMDMDVADMERHMNNLKKQIEEGKELKAPFDGVITQIYASPGMYAYRTSPLLEIGNTNAGYVIKHTVTDANAGYFTKAEGYLTDSETKIKIKGEITDRAPVSGGLELTIKLDPGRTKLKPDAPVKFELSGKTEEFPTIVPAAALIDNSFVYLIVEEDGPLGTETHVRKTFVEVKAKTWESVAVSGDLVPVLDRVVTSSDRVLADERVKIAH